MKKTTFTIKFTKRFKKDYKLALKRGLKIKLLEDTIQMLAMGKTLPERMNDHLLGGDWIGYHECHLQPDWLLIYCVENDMLVLTLSRTGTHADLFDK